MTEKRPCKICGKIFQPSTARNLYCGKACKKQAQKNQRLEYVKEVNEERKKPEVMEKPARTKPTFTLSEIVAAAKKEGISYGEYVTKYGL